MKGKKSKKKGLSKLNKVLFKILLVIGVATAGITMAADWGAEHQFVGQPIVAQSLKLQLPVRIEDVVKEQIVISPLAEKLEKDEEFTPIEQKIIDMWGYKDGVIALAVFKCESGLRADAVNWATNDVGIAQINFPIWKDEIKEEFGYTLVDLFDIDKNLKVAYYIWDRADGEVGNDKGSFEPWVVFNNGTFVSCID